MRVRTVNKSKIFNLIVLQVALLALLWASAPAGAQSSDGTSTNTSTQTTNGELETKPYNTESGTESAPVRKDAWTWYWNEKAHIDTSNSTGFWGDDAISNLFKNLSNTVLVPFWNAAMEYDFVRAGVLLIVAGMLLGIGASLVMPKKPDKN